MRQLEATVQNPALGREAQADNGGGSMISGRLESEMESPGQTRVANQRTGRRKPKAGRAPWR
jgi:hypothetical protein